MRDKSLHHLLIHAAKDAPNQVAISTRRGTLTYGQLLASVKGLAAAWYDAGLKPGTVVPLVYSRGLEAVSAIYALSWLGCPYVPLDPLWPAGKLRAILKEVDAAYWVCSLSVLEHLREHPEPWSEPPPSPSTRCPGDLVLNNSRSPLAS